MAGIDNIHTEIIKNGCNTLAIILIRSDKPVNGLTQSLTISLQREII